jgi:hypothetical protein
MRRLLGCQHNITLLDPCGHLEMLRRMQASDLILSDSGGMQEEAPALGIPLLILRDRTERPEGIASGNAVLVGRQPDRILSAVEMLFATRRGAPIDAQAFNALWRWPVVRSHRGDHRQLAQAGRTSIAIAPDGDTISRAVDAVRFPNVAA